jgi:uncharacterized protein
MDATTISIPQELFAPAESSSFAGTYTLPVLKAGPDLYDFAEPLTWSVEVTNTGEALLVTGTVEGVGRTACARCLDPFDVQIIGDVEGYFLMKAGEKPDEEMEEDEFSVLDPSNTIDLVPLLNAAILVDLPLVPLCREDCKGLCPDCGINLNEETCDCAAKRAETAAEEEDAKNPFAALKDLHLDEETPSGETGDSTR